MKTVPYDRKYKEEMFRLWSDAGVREGYAPLTYAKWEQILPDNPYFSGEQTFLLEKNGRIGGFVSGTVSEAQRGRKQGYISCLLLFDEADTPDCARYLLAELEASFRREGAAESVWSFRNPIHLPWVIPEKEPIMGAAQGRGYATAGNVYAAEQSNREPVHGARPRQMRPGEVPFAVCVHDNAPGVPCDRPLYRRMEENGYRTLVKQCALYLDLKTFTVPAREQELKKNAGKLGYQVEWYDSSRHAGLTAMVEALGNPQWNREIPEAAEKINMLVAVKEKKVVGFAGPVYPESTGRGYFAGIAVDAAHGRHGLGSLLFYRLCEEEKRSGASYLSFFTGEESHARRIYESAGAEVRRSFAVMAKEL